MELDFSIGTVERNTGRGLCAQREFFPLPLRTGLSGVKLGWAHRLESLCLQLAGRGKRKCSEKCSCGAHRMAQSQFSSDDRAMLYIVATPIGNLGDITLRAIDILKSVDAVAAEDTRYSGILLKHFGIKKPLVSFHEHNEAMRTAQLIERLAAGENIALVTDAGMPGLSDPGARLIRECIRRDLPFTIVPGPSSILT